MEKARNVKDVWYAKRSFTRCDRDYYVIFVVPDETGHPCVEIVFSLSCIFDPKVAFFVCSTPKLIALRNAGNREDYTQTSADYLVLIFYRVFKNLTDYRLINTYYFYQITHPMTTYFISSLMGWNEIWRNWLNGYSIGMVILFPFCTTKQEKWNKDRNGDFNSITFCPTKRYLIVIIVTLHSLCQDPTSPGGANPT